MTMNAGELPPARRRRARDVDVDNIIATVGPGPVRCPGNGPYCDYCASDPQYPGYRRVPR
eukprot:2150734-Rhodomonas_salina.1